MKDFKDLYTISNAFDEDSETIPLMTSDDESVIEKEPLPDNLAILPLKNTVLLPGIVMPITVNRDKSIDLVKAANKNKEAIGVVAQSDDQVENPDENSLSKIGTVAKIIKLFRMPEGNITVIIQGKQIFEIEKVTQKEPYLRASIKAYTQENNIEKTKEFNALIDSIKEVSSIIIEKSPNIPSEANFAIKNIESDAYLVNFIISNMYDGVKEKQELLELKSIKDRSQKVLKYLSDKLQIVELKNNIQSKVRTDIEKQQREYYLNQQIKQIQQELGQDPVKEEVEEFQTKAKKKKWVKQIQEKFDKSLNKFQKLNPQSAEYSVEQGYIETLLELPWGNYSKDKFDINEAAAILEKDHYGLKKVKERIIEHLAVLKLKKDKKAPILCLYGPPGVGKTSLGKSIAKALGRKYARISLGGLRDEAEIRGHRKTYIGAMPGRIVQSLKKVKTSNPVFVLDEIDKVSNSFHGDPSSALLEVLDPEQNSTFYDNYLEVDYDLSKVMFVATANNLNNVHPALLDRMEIIDITGYTLEEKKNISKKHLLPKLVETHGLKANDFTIPENLIEKTIANYTRESGVRQLEQKLAKIVRRIAKYKACDEVYDKLISEEKLNEILGIGHEREKYQNNDAFGIAVGLAWTSVGGEILFIETTKYKGKGKLSITGNLGDVMKESANIALVYLKSKAELLGISEDDFSKWDIHLHVPQGSTPKDGPSAGITIFTALASLFTQKRIKKNLAMTGEITLRGKVLPVGGIKEKILAAKRADITHIILCLENKKDIEEIEKEELEGLNFTYVNDMKEVFEAAIEK